MGTSTSSRTCYLLFNFFFVTAWVILVKIFPPQSLDSEITPKECAALHMPTVTPANDYDTDRAFFHSSPDHIQPLSSTN